MIGNDIGSEHPVPEARGDAKIAGTVDVVMQHVPALQAGGVGALTDGPMMDDVMGAGVPEIAEHQSGGEAGANREAGDKPQRQHDASKDNWETQPDRRADQRPLVGVVRRVQVPDVGHVMKHQPVERVLDQRPAADPE